MDTESAFRLLELNSHQHHRVMSTIRNTCYEEIRQAAAAITNCYKYGGKVLLFGNGGSAGDAQHIAGEFVNQYLIKDRRPLPAIALSANSSVVTAIGNDHSFIDIFSQQIEAFGHKGDVAIGLTTSGTSANVLRALNMAKHLELTTIALVGENTTNVKNVGTDVIISVASNSTPRIQEAHMFIAHTICEIVEIDYFGKPEKLK